MPGPSGERLPHFRLGFTPSDGEELQSEYVVARKHGADAIRELRRLAGSRLPFLLTSEIRTVAAGHALAQPVLGAGQHCLSLHLEATPRRRSHRSCRRSSALEPFGVRPHWGSCSSASAEDLEAVYPKLPEFRQLLEKYDGAGKFRNEFIARYVRLKQPLSRES